MRDIFKIIVASEFFPGYAPQVKAYKHKLRGKNGRGNPVDFNPQDVKHIRQGLIKLRSDLKKLSEQLSEENIANKKAADN